MSKIQVPGTSTHYYSLKCRIECAYYFVDFVRIDYSLYKKIKYSKIC